MVKPCAVPRCKTGTTKKEKCSVFKVPSNIEQYEKWKAAIPGIGQLKQTQYVCEKHFEDKYILRKWIKHDSDGRIIVEAVYARPRLDPLAVPTIFSSTDSTAEQSATQNATEDCAMGEPSTLDTTFNCSQINPTDTSMIYCPTDVEVSTDDSCLYAHDFVMGEPLSEPLLDGHPSVNLSHIEPTDTSVIGCSAEVKVFTDLQKESCLFAHERGLSAFDTCFKNVDISQAIVSGTTTLGKEFSILIPNPWSVSKSITAEGEILVFSHVVMKTENGTKLPVMERSVTVNPDCTLRYYVYGRVVDTRAYNLAQIFDEALLSESLTRFKNIGLCNGLGDIAMHHVSIQSIFQDYVDRWHHKDCTLISNKKRCSSCMKMRDLVRKKEARNNGKKTWTRIRGTSANPIDQRKLIALRKKNLRERREKIRARHRAQLLKQSLEEKRKEISSIRTETLNERCSSLDISSTQKTLLQEIVSAAGKKDAKNRRYGEEWIMLCILMNIRSPSYYNFLRKNNVLLLPCTRTIRNYFSLINMRCGFDEGFAQLLTKHFKGKSSLQRHGVLLVDEINLRKSVAGCAKNLTYVGLTDFGDDELQTTSIEDQATHMASS